MDRGDLPVGRSRSFSAGCVGVHPPRAAEKSVPRLYGLAVRPTNHARVLLAAATDGIASICRIPDPSLAVDTVGDPRPTGGDQRWVDGRISSAGRGHAAQLRK